MEPPPEEVVFEPPELDPLPEFELPELELPELELPELEPLPEAELEPPDVPPSRYTVLDSSSTMTVPESTPEVLTEPEVFLVEPEASSPEEAPSEAAEEGELPVAASGDPAVLPSLFEDTQAGTAKHATVRAKAATPIAHAIARAFLLLGSPIDISRLPARSPSSLLSGDAAAG